MPEPSEGQRNLLRVATWNMDHWKRTVAAREAGWAKLADSNIDIALLQESVPPKSMARDRVVYRAIGGSRGWGSAVVAVGPDINLEEVDVVRTRYSPQLFPMLGSIPGAVVVANSVIPAFGSVTFVSVYGLIEVYSQTTMFRIVADLIPLFDSPYGQHVVLGGDLNVSTAGNRTKPEWKRYEAILHSVESLGLVNLAEIVGDRPPAPLHCPCGEQPCVHLATFQGVQFDYLFATPDLAKRAKRLSIPPETTDLSDHLPMVGDFDLTAPLVRPEWDPKSFAALLVERFGAAAGATIENLLVWVNRKQDELHRLGYRDVRLDRLPFVSGSTGTQMYIQLDRRNIKGFQWTCSIRSDGNVEVEFQYLSGPFAGEEARREIWKRLISIPSLSLDPRLNGRPTFPLLALTDEHALELFLLVLDYIVDETLGATGGDEATQELEGATGPSPQESESG